MIILFLQRRDCYKKYLIHINNTIANCMLRKIRIFVALFFFVFITLLFLDFTGTIHHWFGWMAKIQFLPALLSLNVGIVIALVALTLIFGRIYCSVICPLGVFQDIVAHFGKMKRKNRYSYSPAKNWLRYGVLVLFVIALIGGIGSFVALLAPYTYCKQPLCSTLPMGKQLAGLHSRTCRQLCLLFNRGLDKKHHNICHRRRHGYHYRRIGMA